MTSIKYTKELFTILALNSNSITDILRALNLRTVGGNFATVRKYLTKFEIDISHFKGKSSNKEKEFVAFEDLKGKTQIKRRLIKLIGYSCKVCGIVDWNNKPITLELEHIDGNSRNNAKENLTLLCPNCHSQTSTFRNKKRVVENNGGMA